MGSKSFPGLGQKGDDAGSHSRGHSRKGCVGSQANFMSGWVRRAEVGVGIH